MMQVDFIATKEQVTISIYDSSWRINAVCPQPKSLSLMKNIVTILLRKGIQLAFYSCRVATTAKECSMSSKHRRFVT